MLEEIETPQEYFIMTIYDHEGIPDDEVWSTVSVDSKSGEMGSRIYHIISRYTPPNHSERVFYETTYVYPCGERRKSNRLKCVTSRTLNRYISAARRNHPITPPLPIQ